ncbi:MAG: endonuclease NucS [candidate division KSB1 bacterium]|nr:endonuclease NucS [candidate division KSB1 bacterium]MDZ7386597.1 endonuclease NucS [candidate division KSB1 bacterium]MDZ7413882.1 endonuclease NucS [candidate division KSB1 bacterium]
MSTEIKTWQVVDGKLQPVDSALFDTGRKEYEDLETWIASNPAIVSADITFIGRQVITKSGPLDLLGIDNHGNVVIVELKRDMLPREALAQAIDYASDIAEWGVERLSEICTQYTGKSLEEHLAQSFPDIDLENININESQRIFLVGFGIEGALERMVNWLSKSYDVSVNAIVLKYVRTIKGDELLTRVAVISEEVEKQRVEKKKKFQIAMSDVPGNYPEGELRQKLAQYFSSSLWSSQRMRKVVIPILLRDGKATREQLKEEFVKVGMAADANQAGSFLSLISQQMGLAKNDFLRQVIGYEYDPNHPWLKEVYYVKDEYRELLAEVLRDLERTA